MKFFKLLFEKSATAGPNPPIRRHIKDQRINYTGYNDKNNKKICLGDRLLVQYNTKNGFVNVVGSALLLENTLYFKIEGNLSKVPGIWQFDSMLLEDIMMTPNIVEII